MLILKPTFFLGGGQSADGRRTVTSVLLQNARLQVLDEQLRPVVRVCQIEGSEAILAAQFDDFAFARQVRCIWRSDLLVMVVVRHDCISALWMKNQY